MTAFPPSFYSSHYSDHTREWSVYGLKSIHPDNDRSQCNNSHNPHHIPPPSFPTSPLLRPPPSSYLQPNHERDHTHEKNYNWNNRSSTNRVLDIPSHNSHHKKSPWLFDNSHRNFFYQTFVSVVVDFCLRLVVREDPPHRLWTFVVVVEMISRNRMTSFCLV